MSKHAEAGHDHAGHGSPREYVKIWAILVVLLMLSVLGPLAEIRTLTLLAAFGIAFVKAALVIKHFMHIPVQPKVVIYFLVTTLVLLALFMAGVAPDVMNHEGTNWVNVAAQEEVARGLAAHAEAEAGEFHVEEAFEATCSPCHGSGGAGDGAAAAALDPHPADFTDDAFWETRDHDDIVRVITEGGAAVGRSPTMAAYGEQFDAEQIEELASFIEALR